MPQLKIVSFSGKEHIRFDFNFSVFSVTNDKNGKEAMEESEGKSCMVRLMMIAPNPRARKERGEVKGEYGGI